MQVLPITGNYKPIKHSITPYSQSKSVRGVRNPGLKSSGKVAFGSVSATRLSSLIQDYRGVINEKRMPPIKSLVSLKISSEELEALLRYLLSDEVLSFELIHSIVDQKRSSKYFIKYFTEKLPPYSDVFTPFAFGSPYRVAYEKYIDTRIKNATSISELLEIRPDWSESFLLAKHKELYHNENFELGVVPPELGQQNFEAIVHYLRQHMDHNRYKTWKSIPSLQLGSHKFDFYFFTDGKTDKNVFGIKGNYGESFIIKLATPENRALDKVNALGTLCKIDTYLTKNYCRNSAPIKYYNHELNASIYDFIEHKKLDKQPTLQEIELQIPDFRDLGLRYYDNLGVNNFFVLDNSQYRVRSANDFHYGVNKSEWITVDNDSVSFDNIFHPSLDRIHRPLPINSDFMNIRAFFL